MKMPKPAMATVHQVHVFTSEEIRQLRTLLLLWYKQNKRDLLWRRHALQEDVNKRVYTVWVSEVMCQQTQVATVLPYYKKWMDKWPTVESLALANLEEVNRMWAGLGYYSRAKSLHTAAKKVVDELGGKFPRSVLSLQKELRGVGRYTAGAIASIAYGEPVGAVDGNAIRVISRLRCIGADTSVQKTMEHLWSLSNEIVDPNNPGDFNQSVMELGATVCLPRNPLCHVCPLKDVCNARRRVEEHKIKSEEQITGNITSHSQDIEDLADCGLCLSSEDKWDPSVGIMNYPFKKKKCMSRDESHIVAIVHYRDVNSGGKSQYLLLQRPSKGLLANLWEFPSVLVENMKTLEKSDWNHLNKFLSNDLKLSNITQHKHLDDVVHLFSHIKMTYRVYLVTISEKLDCIVIPPSYQGVIWVSQEDFNTSAVSTAMKKVFKCHKQDIENKTKKTAKKNTSRATGHQSSLDNFVQIRTSKRKRVTHE